MKKFVIIALITTLISFSCKKILCGCEPPPADIKVTVVETSNIDCNKPVIKIDAEYVEETRWRLEAPEGTNIYVVDRLPAHLNVLNKVIWVRIQKPLSGRDFTCTTSGPTYHHTVLVNSRAQ